MKRLIVLMVLLSLVGCSKLKGDKGDAGDQGVPGEDASATFYQGSITSERCVISIEELKVDELPIVVVYCSDGSGEWIEIPVFHSGTGGNVVSSISYGKVEIWYAYSNGLTEYYIVVAAYPHAPTYERLF